METIIDKAKNNNVLVVAHGNSIRAILKIVEDISVKDIVNVNIPTGIPLAFNVQDDKVSKIVLFGEASDPTLCAPIGKNVMIVKENDINNIKTKYIKNLLNKKKL